MRRHILLIRSHETLEQGWRRRSFGPAGRMLERRVAVAGTVLDEEYAPVRVWDRISRRAQTYVVRVGFDDEDAIGRLRRERRDAVVGVFADPAVSTFPLPVCGGAAVGDSADAARRLGVPALRRLGLFGRGVRVAVVDTGIDGSRIPVAGGWAPRRDYVPGASPPDHGTMVAFDVGIAAPEALIYDYKLLGAGRDSWSAFLSDAISAFADLIERVHATPGRWVVNNSWGLFDRGDDAPVGSPENYSANSDHPFNQIVGGLVAAGADVFFAAGNCGAECPDERCGPGDRGPGASIHGANSHPDVVTVAAVTVTDRRLGYSSQGPGGLSRAKPDLAAFSQFAGSKIFPADSGTSAASAVAVGVAAALRQRFAADRLSPAQLKGLLQRTARDVGGDGWDPDLGYGVIDGAAALKARGLKPIARPPGGRPVTRA